MPASPGERARQREDQQRHRRRPGSAQRRRDRVRADAHRSAARRGYGRGTIGRAGDGEGDEDDPGNAEDRRGLRHLDEASRDELRIDLARVGDEEDEAAIEAERAERHDDRGQVEQRHEHAVDEAEQRRRSAMPARMPTMIGSSGRSRKIMPATIDEKPRIEPIERSTWRATITIIWPIARDQDQRDGQQRRCAGCRG